MNRLEIARYFPDAHFGGSDFAVTTLDWLLNDLQKYWFERFKRSYSTHYECYDFVRSACVAAVECWENSRDLPDVDAIAVGEIFFLPDESRKLPIGGHAICAAFCEKGLVFFDPQNWTLWNMSTAEFQSRFFVRF